MIINKSGVAIRMAVEDLRVMGRATQGVRLIKVREEDSIAAVAKVMHDEDQIYAVDAEHSDAPVVDQGSDNLVQDGASESTPEQTEE
jgi:DNA gyrase subunit A